MEKRKKIEAELLESELDVRHLSMIDEYFSKQSPLAQMVEIKGAFLKLLQLLDEVNLTIIKINRRTSNTNARLTRLEGRVRDQAEELTYLDITPRDQ